MAAILSRWLGRTSLAPLLTSLAVAICTATTAHAGVPSAANSTCPGAVLVGTGTGCCFNVTVRDINNAPVAGSLVRVQFNCAVTLCGTTNSYVDATTNPSGVANFCITGSVPPGCTASITADGVFLCTVPTQSCPLPPPAGLTAWFPLDEGGGTTALNFGGAPLGTYVGSPGHVVGEVSNAMSVSSTGTQYMSAPDHANLNVGAANFTIDAWIRTSNTALNVRTIVDKRAGPSLAGYSMFLYQGHLGCQLADGATFGNYISSSPVLTNDQWHFVAMSIDRGTSVGRLYVDGAFIHTFTFTQSGSLTNTGSLLIGKAYDGSPFNGIIDEVELFSRALDTPDLQPIYASGPGGKCKTPTIVSSAGANGSISPIGSNGYNRGTNATYTITPQPCYDILDVKVDCASVGPVTSYTFANLQTHHTITATFTPHPNYTITASSGAHGSISPSGATLVPCTGSKTFTITPDVCYRIADVLVNGVSQGAIGSYTFSNVTANQTISATFSLLGPFTITASAGPHGTITPSDPTTVPCDGSQLYTMTPDPCYHVDQVYINGFPEGAPTSYTFVNVRSPKTISVTFAPNTTTYTISASAGANGSITPSGDAVVNCGESKTYAITPNPCYRVANVVVNGVSQGSITSYTFTDVQENKTISATFFLIHYIMSVSAGDHGSISPGTSSVACGSDVKYTITPDPCYMIETVLVEKLPIDPVSSYLFTDIHANHAIAASFIPIRYPITVTSGPGGEVSPGTDSWPCDTTAHFVITPDPCHVISEVVVDDEPQGPITEYTFSHIHEPHTISVTFATITYPIAVSAGPNGSITPGSGSADCGSDATYAITPDPCYEIAEVLVNGLAVGRPTSWTFTGVHEPNSISATFSRITYPISVSAGPHGAIAPASGDVGCGSDATYTITPDPCYDVDDVLVNGESVGPVTSYTFTNVQTAQTISATFVLRTYAITVSAGPNGSITPASGAVACGSDATYTITPDPCYDVDDVLVNGESVGPVTSYTFTDVQSPQTISAAFVLRTYAITVSAGPNGSITPASGAIACGSDATYTITPDPCYDIDDVLVNGSPVGPVSSYTFTDVQTAQTISATFVLRTYSITVSAGPNGSITPASGAVGCGSNATYTITPDPCYDIEGVLVNGSPVGPVSSYTFTDVQTAQSISATFTLRPYAITVSAGPNGSITPGSGAVDCGSNATYTITPDPCYDVDDVLVNGESVGPVTSFTFTDVQSPQTISATFVLRTYSIAVSAGAGGSITPGSGAVGCGSAVTYTIAPDPCHAIAGVVVNGVSVGAVASYTFTDVQAAQTISASFNEGEPPVVHVAFDDDKARQGETVEITWTVTDDGGPIPTVDLYVSRDAGVTFEPIAEDAPNTGSYLWLVDGPDTWEGMWKVVATDAILCVGEGLSDTILIHHLADAEPAPASRFELASISPNPAFGSCRIGFSLAHEASVRVSVLDVGGREVARLAEGRHAAGEHWVRWEGRTSGGKAPTGIYFVRYEAAGHRFTRRFVLTR